MMNLKFFQNILFSIQLAQNDLLRIKKHKNRARSSTRKRRELNAPDSGTARHHPRIRQAAPIRACLGGPWKKKLAVSSRTVAKATQIKIVMFVLHKPKNIKTLNFLQEWRFCRADNFKDKTGQKMEEFNRETRQIREPGGIFEKVRRKKGKNCEGRHKNERFFDQKPEIGAKRSCFHTENPPLKLKRRAIFIHPSGMLRDAEAMVSFIVSAYPAFWF